MLKSKNFKIILIVIIFFIAIICTGLIRQKLFKENKNIKTEIVNVSYDPTRELYEKYNEVFKKYYKKKFGIDIEVSQSHGGSGTQARSVIEGMDADIVTLALESDVSLLENINLIERNWKNRFPGDSSPYTSTIVFLVRKGNKKNIKDWDDLLKKDVDIITPDPKSSGGAMWNFLAGWFYGEKKFGDDEKKIKEFMKNLYDNVLVMDSGARGATTTFVENSQGDILISWENEAIAIVNEYKDEYEIIYPSVSILAQPSVAVVDQISKKHGTFEISNEYLKYLYSDEGQNIIAESGYRPYNKEILNKYSYKFDLSMELTTIEKFGGWKVVYENFFYDNGIFDEIYGN